MELGYLNRVEMSFTLVDLRWVDFKEMGLFIDWSDWCKVKSYDGEFHKDLP